MLKMLMAAALLTGQAASPPAAPASPCITRQQLGDISLVVIAATVETARNACRPHLPATAFLATPAGVEFAGRLRGEARQRLISAVAGFARMGSTGGMSAETLRTMGEQEGIRHHNEATVRLACLCG